MTCARGMFSVMARRAAKSGLAAGQDEMGSSGSSREEKEMEQGEAGGDSRVRGGTARQTSGPRKSGVSGRGGDASEGGKTSERRDGGRAVAEEEGGEKSELEWRARLEASSAVLVMRSCPEAESV